MKTMLKYVSNVFQKTNMFWYKYLLVQAVAILIILTNSTDDDDDII